MRWVGHVAHIKTLWKSHKLSVTKDPDKEQMIIVKHFLKTRVTKLWTGFTWLKTESSDGLFLQVS